MSNTYTYTDSQTFTRAHAKQISYRVATDLKRMQRFYGHPTDDRIEKYDREVVELMTAGYLHTITYGYSRNNSWIEPTLRYTALDLAIPGFGDNPGRVLPGANVTGASFGSYLTYSSAWDALPAAQRDAFGRRLPFKRCGAPAPEVDGYWYRDLIYFSGGRGLQRAAVRSRQ